MTPLEALRAVLERDHWKEMGGLSEDDIYGQLAIEVAQLAINSQDDIGDRTDGGPAFPHEVEQGNTFVFRGGMSLRDWFAGNALSGICVSDRFVRDADSNVAQAKWAYDLADAMLKARHAK